MSNVIAQLFLLSFAFEKTIDYKIIRVITIEEMFALHELFPISLQSKGL